MVTRVNNRMIEGAKVNVLDFGADPSGNTDSTAAVHAALDYAHANNTVCYFPKGSYLVTQGYSVDLSVNYRGVAVEGEDKETTNILFNPSNTSEPFIQCVSTGAGVYGMSLRKFSLKHPNFQQYEGVGFNFLRCIYWEMSDVFIQSFDTGVILDECFGSSYLRTAIWDCRICFQVSTSQNFGVSFIDCKAYNATEVGFLTVGSSTINFTDGIIEGCEVGFECRGTNKAINVNGTYFEGNHYNTRVGGGSFDFIVENCTFYLAREAIWGSPTVAHDLRDSGSNANLRITVRNCFYDIRDTDRSFIWNKDSGNTDLKNIIWLNSRYFFLNNTPPYGYFAVNLVGATWNTSWFAESDYEGYTYTSVTVDRGSLTITSPLTFYLDKFKKMKMKGVFTIDSVQDANPDYYVRIRMGAGFESPTDCFFPIYAGTGSLSNTVVGYGKMDNAGDIYIVFQEDVSGSQVNMHGIEWDRI